MSIRKTVLPIPVAAWDPAISGLEAVCATLSRRQLQGQPTNESALQQWSTSEKSQRSAMWQCTKDAQAADFRWSTSASPLRGTAFLNPNAPNQIQPLECEHSLFLCRPRFEGSRKQSGLEFLVEPPKTRPLLFHHRRD